MGEFIPRKMGLQISYSNRAKISAESTLWKIKRDLGEIIRDLCRQKGVDFLEGHLMVDHVHMCLRIPPKHSIAFVIGFLKGKSAVRIHRKAGNKRVTGLHFWARGYCVSTVGLDEATVRKYIREQEKVDNQQLNLF